HSHGTSFTLGFWVLDCRSIPAWPILKSKTENPNRGGATRTLNLRFWRPLLCQLSYTPSTLVLCPWSFALGQAALLNRQRTKDAGQIATSSAIPCAGCVCAPCGRISSFPTGRRRGFLSGCGNCGCRRRYTPARRIRAFQSLRD